MGCPAVSTQLGEIETDAISIYNSINHEQPGMGEEVHAPVFTSHASAVQVSPSSQLVGTPPKHSPPEHSSPVVHALPSLQGVLGVKVTHMLEMHVCCKH